VREGGLGEAVDVGRPGHVGHHRGYRRARLAQPAAGGFHGIRADVGQHHVQPAPGRGGGQRVADPAGTAGYHRDPSRLDPHPRLLLG
jgi:hypothetical protein